MTNIIKPDRFKNVGPPQKPTRIKLNEVEEKRKKFYRPSLEDRFIKFQEALAQEMGFSVQTLRRNDHDMTIFEYRPKDILEVIVFRDKRHEISKFLVEYFENRLFNETFSQLSDKWRTYSTKNKTEYDELLSSDNSFQDRLLTLRNVKEDEDGSKTADVLRRNDLDQKTIEDIGLRYALAFDIIAPSIIHYDRLCSINPFSNAIATFIRSGTRFCPDAFSEHVYECIVTGYADRGEYGEGFYTVVNDGSHQPVKVINYLLKPENEHLNSIKLNNGDLVKITIPPSISRYTDIPEGYLVQKIE